MKNYLKAKQYGNNFREISKKFITFLNKKFPPIQ